MPYRVFVDQDIFERELGVDQGYGVKTAWTATGRERAFGDASHRAEDAGGINHCSNPIRFDE